jgi:hypothetical protein
MPWRHTSRSRSATLDKALVLATWWVITRSMVIHSVTLGILLFFFTPHTALVTTPSYDLILYWAPIEVWGSWVAVFAIVWWLSRGLACIIAGIALALWYFAFGCAFLVAWVDIDVPNTTITGWATYGFLGWAWMCVTYVVWKDGQHVREELAQVRALEEAAQELEVQQEKQ